MISRVLGAGAMLPVLTSTRHRVHGGLTCSDGGLLDDCAELIGFLTRPVFCSHFVKFLITVRRPCIRSGSKGPLYGIILMALWIFIHVNRQMQRSTPF